MGIVVLLPIIAFAALFLLLLGSRGMSSNDLNPWQGKYLLGMGMWGAYLVFLTEGLSLFRGLFRWPIATGWLLGFVIVIAVGILTGGFRRGVEIVSTSLRSLLRNEIVLLGILGAFSLLLLAVALVTPTNNVDALDYHMPRVMEWAQNKTLAHFPTVHESQNIRPYWAEVVILHLRVLWGNDQPAGLAQWMMMISSLVATSGIARLMGGDRKVQWLTAVLTFSIPMGLLQATTTQNDYVSAFWVVCLAYFVVLSRTRELNRMELFGLGLALGLGMLTKGTFFPFAGPLMLWFIIGRVRDKKFSKSLVEGLILLLIVLGTNGPFWTRNIASVGGPFGSRNPLDLILKLLPAHSEMVKARQYTDTVPSNEAILAITSESNQAEIGEEYPGFSRMGVGILAKGEADPRLTQLARMVAMNFVSPFSAFNRAYFKILRAAPEIFSEAWVRSLEDAAWNHEDSAGSPVHLLFITISLVSMAFVGTRGGLKHGSPYALVLISGFVLLSLIGFSGHVFGIRYQLGFFVMGTPLIGLVLTRGERLWLILAWLLLIYSLPYVLLSNMRPIIGHQPWPTRVQSVFSARKEDLLFAINPDAEESMLQIVEEIEAAQCTEVGLSFSRNDLEYQLWYLLGAPQNGVIIKHLTSLPDFTRYLEPDYHPCAVVCTICEELPQQYRLGVSFDAGRTELYLDPSN